MRTYWLSKVAPHNALFLAICLFLLAACGSNSAASTSSNASATATACAQATRPAAAFRTAIGTIASVSGQTLVLKDVQGKSVTVTYTSSTTFSQEVKLAAGDLKEGSTVRVAVTSTGSTYTAISVMVTTGTGTGNGGFSGFPGFSRTPGARGTPGNGGNPCFANRGRGGNGTPAAGNTSFRGLTGTVSQVNGNILVVTDTAGATYTVTLTAQTQIIATKSATAAALKAGEPITVVGKPGSQSSVTANSIAILLTLPRRGPAATPTP